MPKIPPMITSRVIACIRGAREKARPICQRRSRALLPRRSFPVTGDRLTVKGWEQQFALSKVALAIGDQDRIRAEHRAQRRLRGERRYQLGRRGEERADVVGVAGEDRAAPDVAVSAPDIPKLLAEMEDVVSLAKVEPEDL